MTTSPVLSIIVPVYNVEKYISRCARSLFEQTLLKHSKVEFIFINDCTPDHSIEILCEIVKQYPYIKECVKIIKLEKNGGLFMARHHGIMAASGKYIAHFDSDDYAELTMFEKMIATAQRENADMVWCGIFHDLQNGNSPTFCIYDFESPEQFLRQAIYDDRIWCVWGKIFRRTVALQGERFLPEKRISYAEDLRRTVLLIPECRKIVSVRECLYHYCENMNSISKRIRDDFFVDVVEVGNFMKKVLPEQYNDSIIKYKRKMLLTAVVEHKDSCYRLYPGLWPEAKRGILKADNYTFPICMIIFISRISYPFAVWIFHGLFPFYLKIKGLLKK